MTLVERTLEVRFTEDAPEFLIGDGAYDSNPLDEQLLQDGITLVAPHRSNRTKEKTQDGRTFRRYKRRWKVERLNAWLQSFRKVLTRFDVKVQKYTAFVQFAAAIILEAISKITLSRDFIAWRGFERIQEIGVQAYCSTAKSNFLNSRRRVPRSGIVAKGTFEDRYRNHFMTFAWMRSELLK